ncbi:involucrin-like isoform X2 [Phyllopteryx taeniolatus]|uniref:involucrin-like isoform X2 n=1 Tax=Phyllopteryx taeniolatus TaxID=161469 RepID=UPI002AD20FE1|nr:involucrin-like isoform X2 [Phyllopteryx taeniolatus]
MFAKRVEELPATKVEDERQSRLQDAVCKQPRVVLHRADVSENLHPEQQAESPHIKEEVADEEVYHIKEEEEDYAHIKEEEEDEEVNHIKEEEGGSLHIKEEEQEEIIKVPLTGVPLKSEDEGQSEDNRGAAPPCSSSSQHMTREGDEDHCGGSQADGLLAPLSDSDDMTSHSPHTDEEESEGSGSQAGTKTLCSLASCRGRGRQAKDWTVRRRSDWLHGRGKLEDEDAAS